ncbi:amidohydrolase family protein [Mycobacterium sp. SMC-4]|uniref:amidohydrolase family protein n=1 Tax=Mycobacterium sp. SMC-4 TaxID=2857059 RepID=UPI003D07C4FF
MTDTLTPPVVDVHAHLTVQCFRDAIGRNQCWHGMTSADGELDNPRNHWSTARRIEEMDKMGVDIQLVSPTDAFYQYRQDAKTTAALAVEVNDEIAELKRDRPTRFGGLGTLPMQDVGLAVAELARGMNELDLDGFMIEDHVNGLTYDNPVFSPLWEAAEELGAFLFIHQNMRTSVAYRTRSYFLPNSIGNLVDRAITYATFVYGGVMDDYPNLKVCLGHAGGYTPLALDRLDHGWHIWPSSRGRTVAPPSTYARRFYYDSVTYQARTLRFLLDVVGADRVLLGTDWPAPMSIDDPVAWLAEQSVITDDEREFILRGTAATLFGNGQ